MSRSSLSTEERFRIKFLREQGMTFRDIADRVGRSDSVVRRVCVRFDETGSVEDRPRSDRPRSTSQSDDRNIVYTVGGLCLTQVRSWRN